jgi:hypothetical protein
MIQRELKNIIINQCFKGKVILLTGTRQVGKTTLLRDVLNHFKVPSIWLNADESDVLKALSAAGTSSELLQVIGPKTELLIIDEAQQVKDIGHKLKLLYDTYPKLQIIATGSSSFDLQNAANEPLTGRKREYHLYPISHKEMVINSSLIEEKRQLETRLIYGSYPEVINNPGEEKNALQEISNSYLYKDILQLDGIRKSATLKKLLQALALQLGNEVSFNELSNTLGNIDTATVEKYLDILEKTFVIYKLPALCRNIRTELKKGKKYYFYDNGIRNIVINNFQPLPLRIDKGALWENYLLSERLKHLHYNKLAPNTYFWRTHDQAEIDYIEEADGYLHATEIKWSPKSKKRFPKSFETAYPEHTTNIVNTDNYTGFIS